MSFGFSPSDIVAVITIAVRAYRGWNSACGEYSDITVSLNEIRILLERIRDESQTDDSVLIRNKRDADRLKGTLAGVRSTAAELNSIIERFRSLGADRSRERNWDRVQRNWDRFRLGNTSLDALRLKLGQHVTAITAYLQAVGLISLANIEHDLHALPELMQRSMNALAAEIRAGRREGSIMTAYSGDDTQVWREFRRELISEGFKSSEIHKFKPRIKHCLQQWMGEGFLEEEEPQATEFTERETDRDHPEPITDLAESDSDSTASAQSVEADGALGAECDKNGTESQAAWRVTEDGTVFRPTDVSGSSPIATLNTDTEEQKQRDNDIDNHEDTRADAHSEDGRSDREDVRPQIDTQKDVVDAEDLQRFHLRLIKANNCTDNPTYCTVICIVPNGDIRLFAEFALNPRPLLPLLGQHLPDNATFRSLAVWGPETLIMDHTGRFVAVSNVTEKGESLGLVNGVEIFLSFGRILCPRDHGVLPPDFRIIEDDYEGITLEWLLRSCANYWDHTEFAFRRRTGNQSTFAAAFASISNQHQGINLVPSSRKEKRAMSNSSWFANYHIFFIETDQDLKRRIQRHEWRVRREWRINYSLKREFTELTRPQKSIVTEIMMETASICSERDFEWRLIDIQTFGSRARHQMEYRGVQIILKRVGSTCSTART